MHRQVAKERSLEDNLGKYVLILPAQSDLELLFGVIKANELLHKLLVDATLFGEEGVYLYETEGSDELVRVEGLIVGGQHLQDLSGLGELLLRDGRL